MTTANQYTIYHNPRCSKSRQTLALLEEHNITPAVVEYLRSPPSLETLTRLLSLLAMKPREIMRTKESAYADQNLGSDQVSDAELLQAIIENPILLERPIVTRQRGTEIIAAAIGRPPENILQLL